MACWNAKHNKARKIPRCGSCALGRAFHSSCVCALRDCRAPTHKKIIHKQIYESTNTHTLALRIWWAYLVFFPVLHVHQESIVHLQQMKTKNQYTGSKNHYNELTARYILHRHFLNCTQTHTQTHSHTLLRISLWRCTLRLDFLSRSCASFCWRSAMKIACVAVCVAVRRSASQCVAVRRSVSQCVAVSCSTQFLVTLVSQFLLLLLHENSLFCSVLEVCYSVYSELQ